MRRAWKFILMLVMLLAVLVLSGCLGGGKSYVISGTVTDSEANGLPGVKVMITGGTKSVAITNDDGEWDATVKGKVTITPEPQKGYLFSPPARTKITESSSELNFERISNKILWYIFEDPEHQFRTFYPISPPDILTDIKYEIVVQDEMLTEVPSGYDVLVLSDTGAGFDLSEFSGRIIVTLDGGVAPLMYWMTGDVQREIYWDFYTEEELKWTRPIAGSEVGAGEDAHVYTLLDGEFGFTRRDDLIQAGSVEDRDDVVLYRIENEKGSWWWLHIGPHFGDYVEEIYTARAWEIIHYTLDLLNGYDPVFPPLPDQETASMSFAPAVGRN
ncbi:MAG: carboxypeptidase-like regulatory domain-containing protein [Limnochordia bacterium]